MKRINVHLILLLGVLALGACNSRETKTADFTGSECKSHLYIPSGPMDLYTMEQSEPYQGLRCMSWQHDADAAFSLDLINFTGACGAQYEGVYNGESEGTISLAVENPSCVIASCGYCIYDWSFQIENVTAESLTVNIAEDYCPGDDQPADTYTLAVSNEELLAGAGMACEYKATGMFESPDCGTLHQPCRLLEGDTETSDEVDCAVGETQCNDGLTCVQTNAMTQATCVAECTEDTDCPLPPLLRCQGGLCLLP